jgi:hypothetical protein
MVLEGWGVTNNRNDRTKEGARGSYDEMKGLVQVHQTKRPVTGHIVAPVFSPSHPM